MGAVYSAIEQNVEKFPNKSAIVLADGGSLSYRELQDAVRISALNLYRRLTGIDNYQFSSVNHKQNPPLILLTDDNLESIVTVIALNLLGLTVAPINPKLGADVLTTTKQAINAGAVLYDENYTDKANALQNSQCAIIDIGDLKTAAHGELPVIEPAADCPYLLTLSSGSTGDPKPVIYTDAGKRMRAEFTASEFGFTSDDTILCASPFFHSLGQRLTFMPLVIGATMVLLQRFGVNSWLDAVHTHHVTVTICVSSHLFALKNQLITKDPRIRSIRALVSSSASIDAETKFALFDDGNFDFYEMYGASEIATATRLSNTDPVDKRGSVGSACLGIEIKIRGTEDQQFGPEHSGEILIKSPLCSPGYFQRHDLNAAAFNDGWFCTGDIGYIDEDSFLYFVDRTTDVIVSGGSNLYPSDIESCIRTQPQVKDCIVIGVNDSYLGEAVVAIVVAERTASSDLAGNLERVLRQNVRAELAPAQQPLLYFIVDELPLNAAGKVDRKALRHQYNQMDLDPSARFNQFIASKAGA